MTTKNRNPFQTPERKPCIICEGELGYMDSLWCQSCEKIYGVNALSILRTLEWARSAVIACLPNCPPGLAMTVKSAKVTMDGLVLAAKEGIRNTVQHDGA